MVFSRLVAAGSVVSLDAVSKRYLVYRRRASGLKERLIGTFGGERYLPEVLWALHGVSCEIARGETFGVIGPNGCGKSTLLQMIAGILVPDEGAVAVGGRVTSLLELGAGFSPDLTGRENVFLNASLHGVPRVQIARRFDDIVAFAELERFIDTPVRNYSSGMYMRLGFAVAVHLDPEIVLVDEAFAVGDEGFQRKCLRRLREFQTQGITVVLVSHDLLLVERMAARALLLWQGQTAASGAVSDVVARYHALAAESGSVPGEYRWGNRAIVITRVTMLDGDGRATDVFRTGDAATIALDFEAPARVDRPVFGIGIHRDDGVHLTGPNTRMSGYPIEFVEGRGTIRYRIDALPFLPGRYLLAASAYDEALLTAYDHRERVASFTVVEGGTRERFGLVALPASWSLAPGSPTAS